jgi:hypothetical protein
VVGRAGVVRPVPGSLGGEEGPVRG